MARSELYDINGSGAKGIELTFASNEGGKGFYVCATSFLQRFIKGESLFGAEILCGNNEGDFVFFRAVACLCFLFLLIITAECLHSFYCRH